MFPAGNCAEPISAVKSHDVVGGYRIPSVCTALSAAMSTKKVRLLDCCCYRGCWKIAGLWTMARMTQKSYSVEMSLFIHTWCIIFASFDHQNKKMWHESPDLLPRAWYWKCGWLGLEPRLSLGYNNIISTDKMGSSWFIYWTGCRPQTSSLASTVFSLQCRPHCLPHSTLLLTKGLLCCAKGVFATLPFKFELLLSGRHAINLLTSFHITFNPKPVGLSCKHTENVFLTASGPRAG